MSLEPPHAHGDRSHTHQHHGEHVHLDTDTLPDSIDVYDTTLRDGSQQEGISLSVEDKLRVARQLDALGVAFIEGGWPGANPKDEEFFQRAKDELKLEHATLVAFGSTRRPNSAAHDDSTLANLIAAETEAVCIVAKSSDLHVIETLNTSLDEAIAMVRDSVEFLRANGRRVFLDAEHFFDGFRGDPEFSLRILNAAEKAGAETLVLCDTNGGSLPDEVEQFVARVRAETSAPIGVHFHNDSGCAVANSLAAVRQGATQVQGCVNGYGERAGNADLSATIANLTLKMGVETIPRERFALLTPVARHISEITNMGLDPQRPYVGVAAFAHKAGLHTSAIARRPDAYEHVPPASVGNGTRFVVSELAGRSTLALKATELGIELGSDQIGEVLEELKHLEHAGYHFEVADGSLELLMRAASGTERLDRFFTIESFRVITDWREGKAPTSRPKSFAHAWGSPGELMTEATVKIHVGEERVVATAEGNGPVNALDAALRSALHPYFPELDAMHLADFRVRVVDTKRGTGATTRVLIDSADGDGSWSTIGVSENIIESSWQALVDSVIVALLRSTALPSLAETQVGAGE